MPINEKLLQQSRNLLARHKQAFVAAGDPSMGGAPPAGDPAAGGGGMDPAAAGGAPPAGGGGEDIMTVLQPMIQQAVQQAMMTQGGGAGGAGGGAGGAGGLKPKIDVNVEIMQMKKILARIADALSIPIPASEMVATPQDLMQMATSEQQSMTQPQPPEGGGAMGQIQPTQPMKAAAVRKEWENGTPFSDQSIDNSPHRSTSGSDRAKTAMAIRMRMQQSQTKV